VREEEPRTAPVPRVVGDAERAAARRLLASEFTVSVVRRRRDRVAAGVVYAQRPRAGLEKGSGAIVTLFVARGVATTVVPQVTGLPVEQAAQLLRDAALRLNRVPVISDEPAGTVVAQVPRFGTRVDRRTAVRVNVAAGTSRARVPDVLGRTAADARTRLRRDGLPPPEVVRVASAVPVGTVVRQSPVGGSLVGPRVRVRVEVSDGSGAPASTEPENPHTPVLLGFGEREAVEELERQGYVVRVRARRVTDPRQDGTVIDQQPAEGAPRGSVITLVVGDAGA
jgi:serine/threonine-protein kinase